MPDPRDIRDVHQEIAEEAASIADAEAHRQGITPFGSYGLFEPRHHKLGIKVNDLIVEDDLLESLQQIASDALQQALVARGDLTVGLILGDARQGRNYFDRH